MERHYYWFLDGGRYATAVDNNFGITATRLLNENEEIYEAELRWMPGPGPQGTPAGAAYQPRTVKVRPHKGYAGAGWVDVHKYADEERAELDRLVAHYQTAKQPELAPIARHFAAKTGLVFPPALALAAAFLVIFLLLLLLFLFRL